MTQSVNYVGTGPTTVMGGDSPDSAGKVYYRLTLEPPSDLFQESIAWGFQSFGDSLTAIYAALGGSSIVIPTSPAPVDDGTGVGIVDVAVAPQGGGNSVGDLVNLVNGASYGAALFRLERVKLQNVSTTQQAQDRQSIATSAQAAASQTGIVATLKSWWTTIEGDLKWIIVGLGLLVVGYIYFTSRRKG
jgi:hypothetical protein